MRPPARALLDRAYLVLARRWIVVLFANLVIVFLILFALIGTAIPDGAPGIVDLQLAFSVERFTAITAAWGEAATADMRASLLPDYVFPLVYAVALSSAVAWFSSRRRDAPPYAVLILFALPFVAALCDYVENTAHWFALERPFDPPAALVLIASVAAAIKWALLALVLIVVVAQFVTLALRSRSA